MVFKYPNMISKLNSTEDQVTTGDIKITSVQPAGKHSRMIILPKKMCTGLGIDVNDAVQIVKTDNTLVISKCSMKGLGVKQKKKKED